MKCNLKMMIKAGLGLTAAVAMAYTALPATRELIAAFAPALFLLICPLMMFFMMKGMHSCHGDHKAEKHQLRPAPLSAAKDSLKERG